jgi:soluble lytic murein transglycosylase
MRQPPGLRLLLLFALTPLMASAQTARTDAAREEFRAAWARVADPAPAQDSAALRSYLLYPWLQGARLRQALGRVGNGARDERLEASVRAFLSSHRSQPLTWELQRTWLGYLAQRQAWPEFLAEAPDTLNDPSLRCHALTARIALEDLDGVREAALSLWPGSSVRNGACQPVFDWLDSRARLSDDDIETLSRASIAARQPLPKMLQALPRERRAVLQVWDRMMAQPARGLRRFVAGENLLAPEPMPDVPRAAFNDALLETFDRLARRDSREAGSVFPALLKHPGFDNEARAQLRRSYALGLAYDRDPEAVRQFRDVPDSALDTLAREWRVRAALLHGDWRRASQWIEAMPEAQRSEPRWRYWQARLHARRRDREQARALYAEVAQEREYYGFLAAEQLGKAPDLRPQPLSSDGATLDLLAATPPMLRALELLLVGLPEQAMSEFRFALRDLPDGARAQAARLADAWGWHHAAVLLLSELRLWDDLWLRFPLPHDHEVNEAAGATGLPAEWIHTVIRTESLYNPRAVSGANAMGLMQLLLPTARQVAQRAKLPIPRAEDLFEPEVNIALGARYLRELHQRYDGHLVLMLAAYNAGQNRIPGWLPKQPVDADIWIENIPFNETRNYVQRALYTLVVAGWRRNDQPAPVLPLLREVPPAPKKGKK